MRYWVFQDNQVSGPFDPEELSQVPGYGSETMVCPEGRRGTNAGDWRRAGAVAELSHSLGRPAPKDMADLGALLEKSAALEKAVAELREQIGLKEGEWLKLNQSLQELRDKDIGSGFSSRLDGLEQKLAAAEAQSGPSQAQSARLEELERRLGELEERQRELQERQQEREAPPAAPPEAPPATMPQQPPPQPEASAAIQTEAGPAAPRPEAFVPSPLTQPILLTPAPQEPAAQPLQELPAQPPQEFAAQPPFQPAPQPPATLEIEPPSPIPRAEAAPALEPPSVLSDPQASLAPTQKKKSRMPLLIALAAVLLTLALALLFLGGGSGKQEPPAAPAEPAAPQPAAQPPAPQAAATPAAPSALSAEQALEQKKQQALELVKNWPLPGGGSVSSSLEGAADGGPIAAGSWEVAPISDDDFQVSFSPAQAPGQKASQPYRFEAILSAANVTAQNAPALHLLTGKPLVEPPKTPRRAVAKKRRPARRRRSKSGKLRRKRSRKAREHKPLAAAPASPAAVPAEPAAQPQAPSKSGQKSGDDSQSLDDLLK
ncbi:MAG: hypothetical protein KGO96_02610 [Elusimicrobia bacterium]|nr:hypothetical protein [Elusimicrobiota bacterium]MDE2424786.1 hypothetical protein [Elusimicrobiota bacterium]